jgi:RNA 3'-terminal phosphate cyclase (ATP)
MTGMLVIDGSLGGGQILRSSLSLSLITGTPFRIENIRAGRRRPGLMRQHLTCVRAAAEIASAAVAGAELGSAELEFSPGAVRAGDYGFAVGSAGSTGLVLETVLPALALADAPSTIEVRGGTHNPLAPPFEFLVRALFPLLARMGIGVEGELHRTGYYPAGGGHASYRIRPARTLAQLELVERGALLRCAITARVAALPSEIGAREVTALADALGWDRDCGRVERDQRASGPGNAVVVTIESEAITEVVTGFGQKGVPAETIARDLAREVQAYLAADVPVGPHLADQLLLWLALAGRGRFRTVAPTEHTRSHLQLIGAFLDVSTSVEQIGPRTWEVSL